MSEHQYAGFWLRVVAALIDTALILIVILPLMTMIYGKDYWQSGQLVYGIWDILFNYILPTAAVILFWIYKSATPGKMVLGLKIVDATSAQKASTGQLIGRYFAYIVAILPLFLGIICLAFDKKKQGLHDKLSGTMVVKKGG